MTTKHCLDRSLNVWNIQNMRLYVVRRRTRRNPALEFAHVLNGEELTNIVSQTCRNLRISVFAVCPWAIILEKKSLRRKRNESWPNFVVSFGFRQTMRICRAIKLLGRLYLYCTKQCTIRNPRKLFLLPFLMSLRTNSELPGKFETRKFEAQ